MNRRTTAAYLLSAGLVLGSGAAAVAATASGSPARHPAAARPAPQQRVEVVTQFRDVTVTDPAPATTVAAERHRGSSGSHTETSEPAEPTTVAPPATVPAPPTTEASHEAEGAETGGTETEGTETETSVPATHSPETEAPEAPDAPEAPEHSGGHGGGD